jgi:hypothetical protein
MLTEHLNEVEHDDDIETDRETLNAGLQQCYSDLQTLSNYVNKKQRKNQSIRANTAVVKLWSNKGFWFSKNATRNLFIMNK